MRPSGAFAGIEGHTMNSISVAATHSIPAAKTSDRSLTTIALLSCVGLLASVCLMTLGIDLSAGWV